MQAEESENRTAEAKARETEEDCRDSRRGGADYRTRAAKAQTWKTQEDYGEQRVAQDTHTLIKGQEDLPDQQVILLSCIMRRLDEHEEMMERICTLPSDWRRVGRCPRSCGRSPERTRA